MTLAERIVERLQSQLGVSETRGQNDGIPSTRYMGGRREPWCAHMIAWAYKEEGHPLPGHKEPTPTEGNPLASVAFMEGKFRELGWLLPEGERPRRGDIIFLKNRGGSDVGTGRHVGVVELVSEKQFQTIEGNLGNRVGRVVYSFDNPRISSFGRVPEEFANGNRPQATDEETTHARHLTEKR